MVSLMGVPRPTEWTTRDLLQEEVRKREVTVVPEISFDAPLGRLVPDIVLKNGAEYVVETKLGTVADLLARWWTKLLYRRQPGWCLPQPPVEKQARARGHMDRRVSQLLRLWLIVCQASLIRCRVSLRQFP